MSKAEIRRMIEHGTPNWAGWVRANCPECFNRVNKMDTTRSLAVNVDTGYYECHRCGYDGFVFDRGAAPKVKARPEPPVPQAPNEFISLTSEQGLGLESLDKARDYLYSRGIGPDLWAAHTIGVCLTGKYRGRVIIPVINNGKWVGFVARTYTPGPQQRYLYPPGFARGRYLYMEERLKEDTTKPVLVVEGIFDAIRHPNAVACLGKPSPAQKELMLKTERPVVMSLDGDSWREGWAMCHRLRMAGKVDTTYIRLPATYDPAMITHEEMDRYVEESR